MSERIKRYKRTLDSAMSWLIDQLNDDGTMDPTDVGPLRYYKVPRALLIGGKIREANALLDWAKRESFTKEGDFLGPRLGFHSEYYAYLNAWFVWAAQILGRFDISYPGKDFLFRFINPKTGGSCSNSPFSEEEDHEQDLLSTSFNALVGLYFGELGVAVRAAEFLQDFLEQQPDLGGGMWLKTDRDGKLISWIPDGRSDPKYYLMRTSQPSQYYYFVGSPVFFLCKLYGITKDERHLSTARAFFEFADSCGEHAYRTIFTAKVGLGAAHLFQATGVDRFREAAFRSYDFVTSSQSSQGCWMNGNKPWVSVTAELCVWLPEILAILE